MIYRVPQTLRRQMVRKAPLRAPGTSGMRRYEPASAYVVGPYVKQGGVVISERYTTINILRTIEDILGLDHVSLYTAAQRPMTQSRSAPTTEYLRFTSVGIRKKGWASLTHVRPLQTNNSGRRACAALSHPDPKAD